MKHDTLMNILLSIKEGCKTKRSIQKRTGVSWGTCSENINHLEKMGIIMVKKVDGEGLPGPKSSIYAFNSNNFSILGVEVAVKEIVLTLSSLDGSCLLSQRYTQREEISNTNIQMIFKDIFSNFLESNAIKEDSIYAINFALSGAVSTKNLVWIQSPKFKNIRNIDFNDFYSLFPKVRVINLIHDIQARAVDIQHKRSQLGDHFVFLHISNGVGLAIYTEGHFISGHRGLAGELGHIPYLQESLITSSSCFCGQSNCIENLLHCEKLLDYCNSHSAFSIKSLSELDPKGSLYKDLFKHIEKILLDLCRSLTNIFDSKTIILGGKSLSPWSEVLKNTFFSKLQKITWEQGPENLILYEESENSPSLGAAISYTNEIISSILQNNF